jgi:hypothetical protein
VFVTSQGSAYGRLRKALDRRNLTQALSAAAEVPHVGLGDALELCLLLLDQAPAKYARAVLRWHARYCGEVRGVGLEEAQAVLALLALLNSAQHQLAAHALADLLECRQLGQSSEALMKWAG